MGTDESGTANVVGTLGNSDGRAELVDAFQIYFDDLYRYAVRRVGRDAAEDIASETFVRALSLWDRYDPARGSVRSWLYGIAANIAHEQDRKNRRGDVLVSRLASARQASRGDEDLGDQLAETERVAEALSRLRPRVRDAVLLVAGAGLTYEEAARALRIPVGTVRSRMSTGHRLLRRSLDRTGGAKTGELGSQR